MFRFMNKKYKMVCGSVFGLSTVLTLIGMPVMANTIVLTQNSNYSYSDGGEFTAVTTGQNFAGNGYVSGVTSLADGSFQTFCVQNAVDFNPGITYNYAAGSATGANAIQGAIPLSVGAAFLYYEFATDNLTGYNYTAGSGRVTTAGELQAAIWFFMGEGVPSGFPASNQFITLADNSLVNPLAANNGLYGVDVLQLTTVGSTTADQNQLVLTGTGSHVQTAPDGGQTAALLGMSLGGMFLVQLQRRKPAAARI
jgi:hypothetical protein